MCFSTTGGSEVTGGVLEEGFGLQPASSVTAKVVTKNPLNNFFIVSPFLLFA